MNKHFIQYAVLTIVAVIMAIASMAFLGTLLSGMKLNSYEMDSEAEAIIDRSYYVSTGDSELKGIDAVRNNVESGLISVGDYVIESMTSAEYLIGRSGDSAFVNDLSYIVSGKTDSDITDDISDILEDSSRIYAINKIVSDIDSDYAASSVISSDKGSSFDNCVITKSLQGTDGFTIGIRRVEGDFRISGEEVRTDFFVDGVLYQGNIRLAANDDGTEHFVLAWDTAGVVSGEHNVSILIRTSDGRGQSVEGGKITVPQCASLENDSVVPDTLYDTDSAKWYILDAADRNAYVNFVGLSDDIAVSLYDVYGDFIGKNDNPGTGIELLRGYAQDTSAISAETGIPGISNVFYIKVERGEEYTGSDTAASYVMVQSKEVAQYDNEFAAVLTAVGSVPTPLPMVGNSSDMSGEMISLKTSDGTVYDVDYDSVKFMPVNGYLEDLIIRNAGTGNRLNIYPKFDSSTVNYAYYVNGESSFTVTATSTEGYAASVSIENTTSSGTSSALQGQVITFENGENILEVTVNSFSGEQKVYTVYILNGEDRGGFAEDTLSDFPVTYRSGLWLMHSIHPEYTFLPYDTGLDYWAVLGNEDYGSRSLASGWTHPGWVKPDSPVYDGGGWMAAKNDVVNYFLDPRNFLDPQHIFEFEMLSFDANYHTVDGVRAMIAGSFMDSGEYDYAQIIYNAGQTAGVSPYLLASRILQEMGYSGQSALCHGNLPGYEGYYNFYNIGSTPNPEVENGALINGARYAMWGRNPDEEEITPEEAALMLPWDNVEDAITGGAIWIASGYTAVGQNTLYFQKFDVIDNADGLYNHQYAQNISMAYTEGARYFSSYASINMLDREFVFLIPVYDNMPDTYGYLPQPD